jgi:prepilin signal peptidase PulO-like enzyme (type II secretory pathway)
MALPWVVVVAALLGLGWAAVRSLRGEPVSATTVLPFGPCLAASIWLLWLAAAAG